MVAAEFGDLRSQCNIGMMYESGAWVAQSFVEATKWYGLAAKGGLAVAQYNLGRVYDDPGNGDRDLVKAARWYKRAAKQGDADAMYQLGLLCENGEYGGNDEVEAAGWYRRAAESGHAQAQYNLAAMLEEGTGVAQDLNAAASWYSRAAGQGDPDARMKLNDFIDPRFIGKKGGKILWIEEAPGQIWNGHGIKFLHPKNSLELLAFMEGFQLREGGEAVDEENPGQIIYIKAPSKKYSETQIANIKIQIAAYVLPDCPAAAEKVNGNFVIEPFVCG